MWLRAIRGINSEGFPFQSKLNTAVLLRLLILFTAVPLVELWLLLQIGRLTNLWFTVGLVLATGLIGAALARRQGWRTWRLIQEQLAQGQVPAGALLDGLMILVAGALLITPGILTDLTGFALLVPRFRNLLKRSIAARLKARTEIHFRRSGEGSSRAPGESLDESVIDVEWTTPPRDGPSRDNLPQEGSGHENDKADRSREP